MATTIGVRQAPKSSSDIDLIWKTAVAQYEAQTGARVYAATGQTTLEEVWAEISQTKSNFQSFRHSGSKISKIRTHISSAFTPIEALGQVVAHATKAAFPPSEAVFAAVKFVVSTANSVSGDYDQIESFFDVLQTELKSMEILEYQLGTIPELEVAITEVFSSVLGLCGICVEYIRKKRFGKVIQALATGPDATLKNAQEAFHQKVQKVRNIVNNATLSRVIGLRDDTSILQADISRGLVISERINTNVNSFLQNTGQLLDKIERRETATERNEVLEWLSKINFHDKQRAIFDKHHKSTGEWLLNSDIFQAWFSDGVNLPLWCPGIPGAGKTVMLSRAVTYIEENTDRSRVAVSYVYCDYKEPRTEIDMLSIIMRQLAEQCHPLPKEVVLFREKYLEKRTYPSNDDRISVIKAMARIFDKTFIFIDALDECLEQHRENFLGLAKELSGCVRFFITSRPHLDLTPTFPTLLRLDIMADESDVRAYLNHRITTHNRLSRLIKQSPKLKDEIVDTVYRKAEGMFLLAYLQITHLESQHNVRNARKSLENLPQGLYAFYSQAFDRIQGQEDGDKELAIKALSFIYCAKRTLTVDELLHALSVELGDSDFSADNCTDSQILLSLCAGLIWVDETIGSVGLVHYTLQEYFQKYPTMLPENPDSMVAEACLVYLSFDMFDSGPCTDGESLEDRLQQYCFLHYASSHWGHHAKRATTEDLEELTLSFMSHDNRLASSLQVLHTNHTRVNNWQDRFPRDFGALHTAAYWGLASIMRKLLEEANELDTEDSLGATPLHYAAQNGNAEVIQLLLENGAARDRCNKTGKTALALAARGGFEDAVNSLLQVGADVLVEDNEGWMPLHWAIIGSHNNVVRTLLNDAILKPSPEQLQKALIRAADAGNEEAAETLIGRGADINGRDGLGNTPMDCAVPEGREGVVRVLLKHGARLDLNDNYGNSCLHWAIPYPNIARLLLENGGDSNGKNRDGSTPLHWSVQAGKLEVSEILLEFGADINYQDKQGVTALHKAALECNEAMITLLLLKGAQANIQDVHGWTPLHAAAVREHQGSVDLLRGETNDAREILQHIALRLANMNDRALLEHMAETKSGGSQVASGLDNAANSGEVERIIQLLEGGADIDAVNTVSGGTALTVAASLRHNDIVKVLIQHGVDVNKRRRDGWAALHLASLYSPENETVDILVRNGADINLKIHSWTPLLIAVSWAEKEKWRPWVSSYLVKIGADVTAADYHGRTALHWASGNGKTIVACLLKKKGAVIDAADRWARTPLIWAVHGRKLAMVKLLLAWGANPALTTRDGYNSLHIAADVGNSQIVQELLKAGTDINAVATDGCTALDIAEIMGFRQVAKQLQKRGAKRGTFRQSPASPSPDGASTIDEDWYRGFEQDQVAMTLRKRLWDSWHEKSKIQARMMET